MIVVKTFGLQQAIDRFNRLKLGPARSKSTMDEVGKRAVEAAQDNFNGNPMGWRAIKPQTAKRKGSSRILYQSGDLMKTIKHKVLEGAINLVSPMIYAGVHQYGWASRNIPPRKFAVIRRVWLKYVREPLEKWIRT